MESTLDTTLLDDLVAEHGSGRDALIPILQGLQSHYHYVPREMLVAIPEKTECTAADVAGVATFYTQFRMTPAGRHMIRVCIGTACHVKGGDRIFEAFRRHLKIAGGDDTDADRLFTVEKVGCLGCCMLAPAVQIDDVIYGPVTAVGLPAILRDFLTSQATDVAKDAYSPQSVSGAVRLCTCASCAAAGADAIVHELEAVIARQNLPVTVASVACTGISYETPLVEVDVFDVGRFMYGRVSPDKVQRILLRHFRPERVSHRVRATVARWLDDLYDAGSEGAVVRYDVESAESFAGNYLCRQKRWATHGAGALQPLDLEGYRRHGGFKALTRCAGTPDKSIVIDEIERSALRGRGGGGFPTGRKWRIVAQAEADRKFVVCNADEGDPGAFMDRMLLESFPFRILEGMAIAADAVGAREIFIYVRTEYPLAVQRIRKAIALCKDGNGLGELNIKVVTGAGAFVCGEETALIQAIEGRRGSPRLRPPFPVESGLWGCPTLVNNVETFSQVPLILDGGLDEFITIGTDGSKGTKTFALAGKVRYGGLVEVPMGMTIREIVEQVGGGVTEGHTLKAVQIGGPSGGCVPASLADTPVDFDALQTVGAMMGSGGMVVLDERDCMVDVARYFMEFIQSESCGKCTPCRVGTKRMLEILERLCAGQPRPDDLADLEEYAHFVKETSLCGLGGTAPNPVLSTLTYFRDEYEAHAQGRCPAGKCRELIQYHIADTCIGCTKCAQQCPVEAIAPVPYRIHEIDVDACVKCDGCRQICPVGAVEVIPLKADAK